MHYRPIGLFVWIGVLLPLVGWAAPPGAQLPTICIGNGCGKPAQLAPTASSQIVNLTASAAGSCASAPNTQAVAIDKRIDEAGQVVPFSIPADSALILTGISYLVQSQSPNTTEVVFLTLNGTPVWTDYSVTSTGGETGRSTLLPPLVVTSGKTFCLNPNIGVFPVIPTIQGFIAPNQPTQ